MKEPSFDPTATTLVPPPSTIVETPRSRNSEVTVAIFKLLSDLNQDDQERILRGIAVILKLDHIIR